MASIKDKVFSLEITASRDSFCNEFRMECDSSLRAELNAKIGSGSDDLVVSVGGVDWKFMVETVSENVSLDSTRLSVWGRSKTALLEKMEVAEVSTPILASEAVNLLAQGLTVEFQLEDWLLPEGSLDEVGAEDALAAVQRIAEAAGGIVRSSPDGKLVLRPKYPVPLPSLPNTSPDLTVSTSTDVFSLSKNFQESEGYESILISSSSDDEDLCLFMELDSDRNFGRTEFLPGETAYVRVFASPGIDFVESVSQGSYAFQGTYSTTIEDEEISVSDGQASSSYPITSFISIEWDGRALGNPKWKAYSRSLQFSASEGCSGLALAKISYITTYDLYSVTLNDEGTVIFCAETIEP